MNRSIEELEDQPFNAAKKTNLEAIELLNNVVGEQFKREEKKRSRTYAFIAFWVVLVVLFLLYLTGYILHVCGKPPFTLLEELSKFLQYIETTLIGYLFGTRISKE